MYTWITCHSKVVQSPISYNYHKVIFDDHTQQQMVPKLLLQVYVIELNNKLFSDPNGGGLKEARDEENSFIISDSTLRRLLTTKLKQMSEG